MNGRGAVHVLAWLAAALTPAVAADGTERGFLPEVSVKRATRMDWAFVAAEFGARAARVPHSYDSARQRYQLYVPPDYKAGRTWPLIVFLSPGDDPLGWRSWRKLCADQDVFFCAAYGAGNNTPTGVRIRLVLDVFDDVRRRYAIDPDRTYLAGFSGGGRLACTIAFALPEYFGGVLAICGSNPLHPLDYLRHRVQERLSVALVTGEADFNRRESEVLRAPLLDELGIRSHLWLVPKMGHDLPPETVLAAAYAWLEEDLPRRRRDVKERPGLAASVEEVRTNRVQAERLLETARKEMLQPDRVYRGAAMLVGLRTRWSDTDAADQARALLRDLRDDPVRMKRLTDQNAAEEWHTLTAQAQAQERFGDLRRARELWRLLARSHAGKVRGVRAADEVNRLDALLAASPFLGVHFEGQTTIVKEVVRRGPADRAGVQPGDRVVKMGDVDTSSVSAVRRALQTHKPGDKLVIEVERDGQKKTLTVEVGAPPSGE